MFESEPQPPPSSPSFYHLVERGRRAQRYLVALSLGVFILSGLAWYQWRAIANFAKVSKEDYDQEVRGFASEATRDDLFQGASSATNIPAPSLQGSVSEEGEAEAEASTSSASEPVSLYRYRVNPNNFMVEALPTGDGEKAETKDQAFSQKLFLLTIDDAPDEHMLDLAKACSEAGVKAIFFVNGFFLQDKAQVEAVKKLIAMGHCIGNHSHGHSKLTLLSYEEQKKEILDFNQALEDALGVRPRFFRPPFGEYSAETLQICAEADLTLLNWTYGYDDLSAYKTPEALTKITLESPHLSSGATLVFHDRPSTAQAMPGILRGLLDMGYQPVDPNLIASDEPAPISAE